MISKPEPFKPLNPDPSLVPVGELLDYKKYVQEYLAWCDDSDRKALSDYMKRKAKPYLDELSRRTTK